MGFLSRLFLTIVALAGLASGQSVDAVPDAAQNAAPVAETGLPTLPASRVGRLRLVHYFAVW